MCFHVRQCGFSNPAKRVGLRLAGVRSGHYHFAFKAPCTSLKIKVPRKQDRNPYRCCGVYSELRVEQPALGRPLLVPFAPDTDCAANMVEAACGRFACKMDEPEPDAAADFLSFAKLFIRTLWKDTLRDEDVPSFHKWWTESNYTGSRKNQLRELMKDLSKMDSDYALVKAFIKQEEYYPEPKKARGILSPSDSSKCVLGRLFSAIDEKTFKARFFVKGTNPRDWPKRVLDTLGTDAVTETDFTAFESHHRGVFSQVIYYWYMHMIRNLTNIRPLKDLVWRLMLGRNVIRFKHINVEVDYRLMSGALWTSSANGVLNLLFMTYFSSLRQVKGSLDDRVNWAVHEFKGFVEGDDGLCKDYDIQQQHIQSLGVVLKMSPHRNFSEANFCGIVCDIDSLKVIKDPMSALAKMFLLPPKYQHSNDVKLRGLLRARALSYLCNFSSAPILASACHWVLRRTSGFSIENYLGDLGYQKDYAITAAKELKQSKYARDHISTGTRLVAQERFGVSIDEQLRIERAFDLCESDKCVIDLDAYCSNLVFNHGERFLYYKDTEPLLRTRNTHPEILNILEHGLKPSCVSKDCAVVNRKFSRKVICLDCDDQTQPL